MQYRLVIVSPSVVSAGKLTRAELSEAVEVVNRVATENHLELHMQGHVTNLVASYVVVPHGLLRGESAVYVAVRLEPDSGDLVVSTTDSPSYTYTALVARVHKEIYKGLVGYFGKSRVTKKTRTMSNPAWFE
jgi:hypothetical protein